MCARSQSDGSEHRKRTLPFPGLMRSTPARLGRSPELRRQAVRDANRSTNMFTRLLATSTMIALLSVPALAQGTPPAQPAKPAPSAAAPAPAKPATTGAATAPMAAKINLNTATEAELDKLPHVGSPRSKAIIAARTKEKFKSWDDFVARKVVPADVAAAIKDSVAF
jgi:DNA uptake protein ComE-like DNA-binding protein